MQQTILLGVFFGVNLLAELCKFLLLSPLLPLQVTLLVIAVLLALLIMLWLSYAPALGLGDWDEIKSGAAILAILCVFLF